MRRRQATIMVLSTLALFGCPSDFGKGGRIDRAVHKDAQNQVIGIKKCTVERRKEVCGPGQENSTACLECGGP